MHFLSWIFSQYPLDVNSFGNNSAMRKNVCIKTVCFMLSFAITTVSSYWKIGQIFKKQILD